MSCEINKYYYIIIIIIIFVWLVEGFLGNIKHVDVELSTYSNSEDWLVNDYK